MTLSELLHGRMKYFAAKAEPAAAAYLLSTKGLIPIQNMSRNLMGGNIQCT